MQLSHNLSFLITLDEHHQNQVTCKFAIILIYYQLLFILENFIHLILFSLKSDSLVNAHVK